MTLIPNIQHSSLGYAEECLGLHYGRIHQADLGDGQGLQDEQFLARQTYFPILGTCWQSLVGTFHPIYSREFAPP